MITACFCVAVQHRPSSKLQTVTRVSNNSGNPLKMQLNTRSAACRDVLQHHFLLSSLTGAVTRNWQEKQRNALPDEAAARLFEPGLRRDQNHLWPSQRAGDELDGSGRKCEVLKQTDPRVLGCVHHVFAAAYFRCTARMRGNG